MKLVSKQNRFFVLLGVLACLGFGANAPTGSQATETAAFKALFSKEANPNFKIYEVQPGDNFIRIAKKTQVSADLIEKINTVKPEKLRPGMKLKIPLFKFSILVDKSDNILTLKAGEEVLKTYVVSTGLNNSTPVGIFKITDKVKNPTWYTNGRAIPFGHPDNLLGTRWIAFDKPGYGIHGTTEPDKLGQQVSAGCVRMRNDEVQELYQFVSRGTEITITD